MAHVLENRGSKYVNETASQWNSDKDHSMETHPRLGLRYR